MKSLYVLVVFLLACSPIEVRAQDGGSSHRPSESSVAPAELRHVRALDSDARETLERGLRGSALFREFVSVLESSDVIVHIETKEVMPDGLAGAMRFAVATARYRYVRVWLQRTLLPAQRTAILGHELQHVCELADSPAATPQAVRHLFETIGTRLPGMKNAFETQAAIHAGHVVWSELQMRRTSRGASR